VLGLLAHRDPGITGPAADLTVPVIGPLQAGFFMRVDRLETILAVQGGEDIDGVSGAHDEAAAARFEGRVQLAQGVDHEIELAARMFRLGPVTRLENVKRHNGRAAGHRGQQGGVIMDPEVPFEPDNMNTRHRTNIEQSGLPIKGRGAGPSDRPG
jgi:hypothetical protein